MAILKQLELDTDGDLKFTHGKLTLISGGAALAQKLQTRLRTHVGEWVFDQNLGTPWLGVIIGGRPDLSIVHTILSTRILETPGVDRILEMDIQFDRSTRALSVTGRVLPEDDETGVAFAADLEGF